MKITISHEFNINAEDFWSKIFFDEEHNSKLYKEHLKFPEYSVLEVKEDGNFIKRKVHVVPKQEAPAAVQKLLGGSFAYVEEGTFDKTRKTYALRVIPGKMADKIRTEGEFRVETLGPKKSRRIFDCTVEVKVFGIGGMIESFVAKSMQESYAQAAAFTNKWIETKGL